MSDVIPELNPNGEVINEATIEVGNEEIISPVTEIVEAIEASISEEVEILPADDEDIEIDETVIIEEAISSFQKLGISKKLSEHIAKLGYVDPTPIQVQAIPAVLADKDILAQSQTGTGKTAAFALPTIHRNDPKGGIQVLVLTPTRELAQQISDEYMRLGRPFQIEVATIIGGKSYSQQRQQLRTAHVLVATPGRLVDLLNENMIPGFSPKTVVLDEADRMLDMGFSDALDSVFSQLDDNRQTMMFSATFSKSILGLARKYQREERIQVKVQNSGEANSDVQQFFSVVSEDLRDSALQRMIHFEDPTKAIIFCEMKKDADRLHESLTRQGVQAMVLHGDTEQRRREEIMRRFRSNKKALLIATDIAARGLDVQDISHVVNFQLPNNRESYVHRIGRTGRAGRAGKSITFVSMRETRTLQRWCEQTKSPIEFYPIPSLEKLKFKELDLLSEKLTKITPSLESFKKVEAFVKEKTAEEVLAAWMDIYFKDMHIDGPDRIGFEQFDLNHQPSKDRMSSGSNSRSSRDFRGGRSGGGFSRERSHDRDRGGDSRGGGYSRERSAPRGDFSSRSDRPARSDSGSFSRNDRPERSSSSSFSRSDRPERSESSSFPRAERSEAGAFPRSESGSFVRRERPAGIRTNKSRAPGDGVFGPRTLENKTFTPRADRPRTERSSSGERSERSSASSSERPSSSITGGESRPRREPRKDFIPRGSR